VKFLLPPSEGKTRPASGTPAEAAGLSFPSLTEPRSQVLDTLIEVSARDDARELLGVGKSLEDEVRANTQLRTAPAAPAHTVYTGVLFNALGAHDLSDVPPERRADVLVMSGLFGVVGFEDRIPAYRLSMGANLPPLGRMRTWWRSRLAPVLDEALAGELLLDCRSADYRAAWPGPRERVVTVDVVQVRGGKRTVVSHFAKHTRGELVGRLLRRPDPLPATPEDLATAASAFYHVELTQVPRKPASLTIVLDEG